MACLGKSPVTALDASSSLSWGKGNRTATFSGGDQNGNNLRSASYAYNNLNEYTSRTVPGVFDVLGQANASASVTVNGAGTYRHAEFYQSQVTTTNGSGPVWQNVTVTGTAGSLAVTNTGHVLVHPTPEGFWYDSPREIPAPKALRPAKRLLQEPAHDSTTEAFISWGKTGNLLSDGCWTNTWDLPHEIRDSSPVSDAALARLRRCWSERCVAISRGGENRLIAMQSVSAVPTNAWKRLNFAYDYMGRRTRKTVSTWNGSAWVGQYTNLFLYDDWNLLAELNGANNSLIRSYIWGQDSSGKMQGAGGVGGLLAIKPAGAEALFVANDANGNVAGLLDAANGTVAATYGYGPFGELIEMSSFLSSPNPFRFSTKYYDDETDLIYYGYRYYSPGFGRWWGRDPLNAASGTTARFEFLENNGFDDDAAYSIANGPADWNDYVFTHNRPIADYDLFGLCVSLPDSGSGTVSGSNPIAIGMHKVGKHFPLPIGWGASATITFNVCCPATIRYLQAWGETALQTVLGTPPPTENGNVFPYHVVIAPSGPGPCYTVVLEVPSTTATQYWLGIPYGAVFLPNIRIVGSCCCSATGAPQQVDPPPLLDE